LIIGKLEELCMKYITLDIAVAIVSEQR
jgi:hypothetical protein